MGSYRSVVAHWNNKKRLLYGFAFALASIVFTFGCSVKDDLDQMKSDTKKLGETTADLSKKTDQLKDRIENVYVGGREHVAHDLGYLSFEDALSTKDEVRKIKSAMIYMGSLEFQHWQNAYGDTPERLKKQRAQAIELVGADLIGLMTDDFPQSHFANLTECSAFMVLSFTPFHCFRQSGETPYNNWLTLSAFAVALSYIHDDQLLLEAKYKIQPKSLYDLIVDGLKKQILVNQNLSVDPHVIMVGRQVEAFTYLLQLRHNFIAFMILADASNFEDGLWGKVTTILPWQLDLSHYSSVKIKEWSAWLDKIAETKTDLQNLGIAPESNEVLSYYLNSMRLPRRNADGSIQAQTTASMSHLEAFLTPETPSEWISDQPDQLQPVTAWQEAPVADKQPAREEVLQLEAKLKSVLGLVTL